MPDSVTTSLSAAEEAVVYAIRRVVSDPNYRWHMLGTEALRLMLVAEAERQGVTVEAMRSQLFERIDKQPQRKAELPSLRERIESIEEHLHRMHDAGRINYDDFQQVCKLIER